MSCSTTISSRRAQALTNLGVLCLGRQHHRAQLTTAPVIQFIKYDEHGQKVNKLVWDDHTQSPMELIEAVWLEVPDFRERYELPDGLYRQNVPAFDEIVVRELLVNALVHRPYTQRGDIFLNLHPDRLEVVNPGPLPLGVTPQNVLHTTVRRNEHSGPPVPRPETDGTRRQWLRQDLRGAALARPPGTGADRNPRPCAGHGAPPHPQTRGHRLHCQGRSDLPAHPARAHRPGLLAQHDALTARELAATLELPSTEVLQLWLKRLLEWHLVQSAGRTQATRYFVDPSLLRSLKFTGETTLKRIEPHRLAALVREDLQRYPESAISDIHGRIGGEIHPKQIKRALEELIERGAVRFEGNNRWRRYWAVS
jgi:ATP-dependent DNA helicase RecG